MDNLSRTKKNSVLYEKLHTDSEEAITSDGLSAYANRLHEIDDNTFAKMDPEATSMNAIHARRADYYSKDPQIKQVTSFNNEYLDEFINEVKQYNVKKGLRTAEDTQTNILNGIRRNDEHKIQPTKTTDINQDVSNESTESISAQMQVLINDETDNTELVKPPVSPEVPIVQTVDNSALREEMMEETLRLKKQIESQDNELSLVNDHVTNTNRILNFVLVILFLTLLVALGCLAYYLLLNRGLI